MSYFIEQIQYLFRIHIQAQEFIQVAILFFPFILLIEWPIYFLIIAGTLYTFISEVFSPKEKKPYYPDISCIVVCYDEGIEIIRTLQSLVEQLYRGNIQILVMIDSSEINQNTVHAAKRFLETYNNRSNRYVQIIEKRTRGGHASSFNLGLKLAKGEIVIMLDGDCSCDNDMVANASYNFIDPDVVGVSGSLRVRNARSSLIARCQTMEYMFGIHMARVGLAQLGMLNTISGAFGIFRKDFMRQIGGWKNGTAEDLDLILRIRAYFKRHPHLKLRHDPYAIAHTDVPDTWVGLLKQRLRWDGDLYYIYCRRHWRSLRPKFLGWKNYFNTIWNGLLLQLVLPFSFVLYLIYLFIHFEPAYIMVLFFLTYSYYFVISTVFYIIHVLLVSERKIYDLSFYWVLPLMPLYQTMIRLWSTVAIVYEIVMKTHKDTSMAPWWVIRKTD